MWSRCRFPGQLAKSSMAEGRSSLASEEHLIDDTKSSADTLGTSHEREFEISKVKSTVLLTKAFSFLGATAKEQKAPGK